MSPILISALLAVILAAILGWHRGRAPAETLAALGRDLLFIFAWTFLFNFTAMALVLAAWTGGGLGMVGYAALGWTLATVAFWALAGVAAYVIRAAREKRKARHG